MDDDYTYEETRELQKMTLQIEPRAVVAFDKALRTKMPFYRAVNSAIVLLTQIVNAKHGDVIDVPVPTKVGRIRIEVKR